MTANSVSIGILGATGYTGDRAAAPGPGPSLGARRLHDLRALRRPADRRGVSRTSPAARCRRSPRSRTSMPGALDVRVRLPAARHHAGRGARAAARAQGDRPLGRLPAARRRSSTSAPTASRTARPSASGMRSTASPSSRARTLRATDLVANPGCYPTTGAAAAAAAARGRPDRARPDHHRRQVGRHRRRPRRQGEPRCTARSARACTPTGSPTTATRRRSSRACPRPRARRSP